MATDRDDDAVDALFSAARAERPGADLVARVLADAAEVQAAASAKPSVAIPARRGLLAAAVAALGGWAALSGVAAAGVFGLAVGLYAPDEVELWLGSGTLDFGEASYTVTPDLGGLWTEGGDV